MLTSDSNYRKKYISEFVYLKFFKNVDSQTVNGMDKLKQQKPQTQNVNVNFFATLMS